MTLALQPYRKVKARFAGTWRTTRSHSHSHTSTSPVIATKYDGGIRQYVPTSKLGTLTGNSATPAAHSAPSTRAPHRNTRRRASGAVDLATTFPKTAPTS